MKALRLELLAVVAAALVAATAVTGDRKLVEGTGQGWVELGKDDFVNVNCDADTWAWKDGMLACTGKPVGVLRTKKQYTNFELVSEWRHNKSAGNSGIFIWASPAGMEGLKPNQLPKVGIELQILDHGYAEQFEAKNKKKPDWFTTNGDVFPVGKSKMKPFPPISPNGSRSFPKKNTTKGYGNWNHYYVTAKDGEVRLTVNGEEVSGGADCEPRTGHICLESEGSPIDFKYVRIRELK